MPNQLLYIVTLPLIAALVAMLNIKPRMMQILVPALLWLELPALLITLAPVLLGQASWIPIEAGIKIDRTGALFALLSNLVVAAALTHAYLFFKNEVHDGHSRARLQIFYSCASLFCMSLIFVCISDDFGYLWISIEAATLSAASLVYHARTKHSVEATWKYLMISSVGIAFALFGTILIFASSQHGINREGTMEVSELVLRAKSLDYSLFRLGFVFCLLGYGTKAGIFPLHSWLPDAHSEAPAPASAMLSGGLLNCALIAIWRLVQIGVAGGHSQLALQLPLAMGVVTVLAASFFLVRQKGLKRLWAYSSVENVGLMVSAIGLGSCKLLFLLALNHSLAKAALFLLSGNIIQASGHKQLSDIKGILIASPYWALLLLFSAFAVTGAPPFGAFITEWLLLAQSADAGLWWVVAVLVLALTLTFIVVCYHVGRCILGSPTAKFKNLNPISASIIPAILLATALALGTTKFTEFLLRLP